MELRYDSHMQVSRLRRDNVHVTERCVSVIAGESTEKTLRHIAHFRPHLAALIHGFPRLSSTFSMPLQIRMSLEWDEIHAGVWKVIQVALKKKKTCKWVGKHNLSPFH